MPGKQMVVDLIYLCGSIFLWRLGHAIVSMAILNLNAAAAAADADDDDDDDDDFLSDSSKAIDRVSYKYL